jgi:hypothetical protein
MSFPAFDGAPLIPIGPGLFTTQAAPGQTSILMDAANEAAIYIGQVITSDGGSHTIDTTGSSSLGWRTGAVTFGNGGTTVKVGLAAVDTANGPSGRAANASDVITFDVSQTLTGGGGGITANAWQTHVPGDGTKTIANGDFVAFCVQMTARVSDSVIATVSSASTGLHRPTVSQFTGGSYSGVSGTPNAIITFSDGALGYFYGSDVVNVISTRVWNNTGAPKEYGQLYSLPFPVKIYGLFGNIVPGNDFDVVLYSDPLGTPVPEKTVSIDANTVAANAGRKFSVLFSAPVLVSANTAIVAAFKPGALSITSYYKTLASAAHRIVDPYGTSGYGVSRDTGSFSDANSSLDHYYIGLLCGPFDSGAGAAGGAHVLGGTVVR